MYRFTFHGNSVEWKLSHRAVVIPAAFWTAPICKELTQQNHHFIVGKYNYSGSKTFAHKKSPLFCKPYSDNCLYLSNYGIFPFSINFK